MHRIVKLLFEARHLKNIQRTGYQFLETGHESVAEHTCLTSLIGFVMSRLHSEADALKLLSLCLLHDLPESRTGDLNSFQKLYASTAETRAIEDMVEGLDDGFGIQALLDEFNAATTLEAQLARDADQLAFVLDLKSQSDLGHVPPRTWMPFIRKRLLTSTGLQIYDCITTTPADAWWMDKFIDNPARKK